MLSRNVHRFVASLLIVAMVVVTSPVFAAPPAATLTGTVYANDVATPLAGATVVVTDATGTKLTSTPTAADGTFTVAAVAPGRAALALQTKDGAFAVATPVTLAPGETKGVYLALKRGKAAAGDDDKDDKGGTAAWTGGEIAAMTAVLVGFAAAAWVGYDQTNDDNNNPPAASRYLPGPSDK
jgi:hypothetical protein